MNEARPVVVELDSETMWTLADDRRTLTLNLVVPATGLLSESLTVSIDFDSESIDAMMEHIFQLRSAMLP